MTVLRYDLAREHCTVAQLGVDPDKSFPLEALLWAAPGGHIYFTRLRAGSIACYALLVTQCWVGTGRKRQKA